MPGNVRGNDVDGTGPVETADFSVPALRNAGDALDLAAVMTGMSGVSSVDVDAVERHVYIRYLPRFVHPEMIRRTISKAGYGSAEGTSGE